MTTEELINFGILNGWLKALARINDKSDHLHEFSLSRYPKENSIENKLEDIFRHITDDFKTEVITEAPKYLTEITTNWFFGFQERNILNRYILEDKNSHFYLSHKTWRDEWTEEFINLLLRTVAPTIVYKIILGPTKGYYVNYSDEIIFDSENYIYHLHFSVTD